MSFLSQTDEAEGPLPRLFTLRSPFARYLVRRLALTVVTLAGVVVVVFFMTHLLPGNPAVLRAGPLANEELIAQYEK